MLTFTSRSYWPLHNISLISAKGLITFSSDLIDFIHIKRLYCKYARHYLIPVWPNNSCNCCFSSNLLYIRTCK